MAPKCLLSLVLVWLVVSIRFSQQQKTQFGPLSLDEGGGDRFRVWWNLDYDAEIIWFRIVRDLVKDEVINGPSKLERLLWNIWGNNGNNEVIGFGMTVDGTLKNGDLLLWSAPSAENQLEFQDCWIDELGNVKSDGADRNNDYRVVKYSQNKTSNIEEVVFWRYFDTKDCRDYTIDRGTINLVYVRLAANSYSKISKGKKIDSNNSVLEYYSRHLQLLRTVIAKDEKNEKLDQLDILIQPQIVIPSRTTTYWCSTKTLKLPQKHHIVKYEPVLGTEMIHHMEVFMCGKTEKPLVFNDQCESEMLPSQLRSCKHVLAAWAKGAEAFRYPKETGVPIGGDSGWINLVIQVHYHNQKNLRGVVDGSGIRFHVTRNLRENDAGIMEIGLGYGPKMSIPPGMSRFSLTGHCSPECTKMGLPEDGIRVFASQLHTHQSGIRVAIKHFRQGVELREMNRDNHYSSHLQEIRLLPQEISVKPGDNLVTTCTYHTSEKINVTLGGYGIREEMCASYIHYYPISDLDVCKSYVSDSALQNFFAATLKENRNDIGQISCIKDVPPSCPEDETSVADCMKDDASIADCFERVSWSPFTNTILKLLYDVSPIENICRGPFNQNLMLNGGVSEVTIISADNRHKKKNSTCCL